MKTSSLAFAAVLGTQIAPAFATTSNAQQEDVWQLLSQIEVQEVISGDTYRVDKSWPDGIPATPRMVEITGFAVPLYPGDEVRELLLSSDTGFCPLCGSPDHGATLQVTLDEPLTGFEEGSRISVQGTLARVTDTETWQAARMTGAKVVRN
ncbi:hypothetical protein GCM10016455_12100 [Aliiroseovarius zhejiangensis]|uniref:DUF3299 domain-containing protein n=1 Tax=Aliiroseovarius zhejiangensis TaxID=1632025 RepID=A0ABQ3IWN1_9RHOB|nr:hypothetical protein [Aliiroseovarius zhejiangensis]GHE93501.1 hypothetical protein GCM10016455_12100 [Aliiroseovarius zhejiangensis]